jgi:hypothetical protein
MIYAAGLPEGLFLSDANIVFEIVLLLVGIKGHFSKRLRVLANTSLPGTAFTWHDHNSVSRLLATFTHSFQFLLA